MEKFLFGKLLGEMYRIQKRLPESSVAVSNHVIYGLLNGIERIVDDQISSIGYVSKGEEDIVVNVLNEYHIDAEKLEGFNGYYDIERKLESQGITRSQAIKIITLLKAEGRFTNVIDKMDSSGSPSECRTFELRDWDQ
ncbi:hypothetical protein P4641_09130 [Halalkalibacterium halodurans]|uniref:hypothetical protein n=1 Tax=Halalkalibacterium halodurans TaxID=86665 RepID=UPI002E1CE00D|nr:hypothetical protein [Halalkalibacterium halodurans]